MQEFDWSNQDLFVPGKEIEISAGYDSNNESVFKGIIVKHAIKSSSGTASVLSIECKATAIKMTVGRESKYFYDSKDSDVFEEIISDYSIETDISDTGTTHAELVQYHCTDWDFVLSRTEVNGKICLIEDDKIKIVDPDYNQEPVVHLTYGATIIEFEAEMDARFQYNDVKSKAWDYGNQEVIEVDAAEPGIEENGNLTATDLAEVIGLDSFSLQHGGKADSAELQAWADAQQLRNRMAKIQGRVKIQGMAKVKPGNLIELEGVGDRFNGNVFVSAVRHQIAEGIWHSDVQFGFNPKWFTDKFEVSHKEASGLFPAIKGLQIGVVTQLEGDPDGEDRILVRMPIINPDEQGIWARVASLDAGENRGAYFRPEIGDEVIIGFINDDPRQAIVLGGLHSSAKPAPITASDDNHEKGIITRSEMKLLFDDDKKSILIETPNGNKIQLSEDDGSINIEDENGNNILLSSDGIKMESPGDINIKATGDVNIEGLNVNLKANVQLTAEGSAGAELSAGGSTVVKGSIVQIN
jgi:Rhs element Vgr protein